MIGRIGTLVAGTLAAVALAPTPARAQLTRGWDLCFTSGVLSCTEVTLTTTPLLSGGFRYGTVFDVALAYVERGSSRSALQDVTLGFANDPADWSNGGPVTPLDLTPPGGAGGNGGYGRWVENARSSPTDPSASYLLLTSHPSRFGMPEATPVPPYFLPPVHYIGGCAVGERSGAIDAVYTTDFWTCGAGSAYHTSFFSFATLDADRVTSLGVDVYRAYPGSGDPLAPFCVAQTDGSGSVGTAEGDFSDFGDVCTVQALGTTTTPEPRETWLVAFGLVLLAAPQRLRARPPIARGT